MLRKKWLSLLVAVSMVAAMMPTTAFAEEVDTTTGTEVVTSTPKEGEGTESTSAEEKTEPTEDEVKEGAESTEGKTEEGTESAEGETEGDTESTEDKTEEDTESTEGEEDDAVVSDANGNEDAGLPEIALMAEGQETYNSTTVSDADGLKTALQNASDGDVITLEEGTYDVGNLTINAGVQIYGQGVDKTTINGSLIFKNVTSNIKVKNLTLQSDGSSNQAINVSSGCENIKVEVDSCKLAGYLFGVGVNSGAASCKLQASNIQLDNVWCGAGVSTGSGYNNEVWQFDVAESRNLAYAVQAFGAYTDGASGYDYNAYYTTVESFEADAADGQYDTPDGNGLDGSVKVPTVNDNWPAVAVVDGAYYGDLAEAIAAGEDKIVTLTDDVYLDKMLVIATSDLKLDLNGYTITAAEDFDTTKNNNHLINVTGQNVSIESGALVGTANSKHGVNVYGGSVTLKKVSVDVSAAAASATPVVVNGGNGEASVTLDGNVTLTGNGYYAVDLDKNNGQPVTLNVQKDSVVQLNGTQIGVMANSEDVTVNFGENVAVNGSSATKLFIKPTVSSVTVTGLENTNLKDTPIVGAAATVDGKDGVYYTTLQEAVDTVKTNGNTGTVRLVNDVNLGTTPVEVPAGMNLTVEGNNHTITLNNKLKPGIAAFNESTSMEGLKAGTTLVVNNVNFQGKEEVQNGHAVIVGGQGGVTVALNNCNYTNLHEAVYCNNVNDASAAKNSITINGGTFTNVAYSYSVDDGATTGARTDKHDFVVTGITEGKEPETFAVATVDGVGYKTLGDAMTAAQNAKDKTVKLLKDVQLDSMLTINQENLTLDLNGHTISASDSFAGTGNSAHLVDITADNVTIKGGTLVAGDKNNHTLNIWDADNVNVESMTVDGSKAGLGGAPIVIGGSDVDLNGKIVITTGKNSWGSINVDSTKDRNGNPKASTLDVNGAITFDGENPSNYGIYVEDKENVNDKDKMVVTFNKGASVAVTNNSKPGFVYLKFIDDVEASAEGTENVGLVSDGQDGFIKQASSSGSHHNYQWQYNADKHWQLCSDCGSVINEGTHNFQWKQDENGVGYQQCAECGYRKSATQTAAAATTNNATASASASTTTNATATAAIPQTSDASNPLLWVVLLVISGSAFGGLMVYKKKKEDC